MVTMEKCMPNLLLQVYVQELHNSLWSIPEESGMKEARDKDNNIIISDSILRHILPPQLKKMTYRYKVICGCECCIYAKILYS